MLRLARYLAALSLPPPRPLEPAAQARPPKRERTVTKARFKAKAKPARKKAGEAELAKESRRAGRAAEKIPSSGSRRGENPRGSPGR
jgi:hypothetical protein